MAKKTEKIRPAAVVLTANRLGDGRVVWYGADEQWVEHIADAKIFFGAEGDDALARAKDWERREIVVGTYAVSVEAESVAVLPTTTRERIRSLGPTVRPDLAVSPATQMSP